MTAGALLIACLLAFASAPPAFGQTHGYLPAWGPLTPFATFGYTGIDFLGVGFDAGAGFDVKVWRSLAMRIEVRGLLLSDKSGTDRFGLWRVGAAISVGRAR